MKKIFVLAASAALISFSYAAHAQERKNDTTTTGYHVKKDVKKVGNKTANVAVNGESKVVDKTYADKVGPEGQTVYIDKHSKYYYVDSKGKKIFISKMEMKDKKK